MPKISRTVENTRVSSDFLSDEQFEDLRTKLNSVKDQKILVTTSKRAGRSTITFGTELSSLFPGGTFVTRGSLDSVFSICEDAVKEGYSHLIVIGEYEKLPQFLVCIVLEHQLCFQFKISSVRHGSQIKNHGRSSDYSPELILNNLDTKLGKIVGSLFISLFPCPEFKGRQVVTVHNQRDFLFFRRHRYIFDEKEKRGCRIQEIGPSFTLKLKRVTAHGYDPKGHDYIFDISDIKELKKISSKKSSSSTNNKVHYL